MPTFATKERKENSSSYSSYSKTNLDLNQIEKPKLPKEQLQEIAKSLHDVLFEKDTDFSGITWSSPMFSARVIFALLKLSNYPLLKYSKEEDAHQLVASFCDDLDLLQQIKYAYQEMYGTTLWEDIITNEGIGNHNYTELQIFSNQKRSFTLSEPTEIAITIHGLLEKYYNGSKKEIKVIHEIETFVLLQLKMNPKAVLALEKAYQKKYKLDLRRRLESIHLWSSSTVEKIFPKYFIDELKYKGKVEVKLEQLQMYIRDFEKGLSDANVVLSNKSYTSQNNVIFDDRMLEMLKELLLDELKGYGLVRDQAGNYSFLHDVSPQLSIISLNESYISLSFPLNYVLKNAELRFDPTLITNEVVKGERKREEYIYSKPNSTIDYNRLAELIYSQSKKGDWVAPSSVYYFFNFFSKILPSSKYQPFLNDQKLNEEITKDHFIDKDLRVAFKKIENHPPSIKELKQQFNLKYQEELLPFLERYLEKHIAYFSYALADISSNGKETVNEEKIAYSIEDLLWEHQFYLDNEISNSIRDNGALIKKRKQLSQNIRSLLIQLENNPVSFQRMLYFYQGGNLTQELQQYGIYGDLVNFIPKSFIHQWQSVRSIGKRSQTLNDIEREVKERPKHSNNTANGAIFEYYDFTTQEHRYRYLIADKDTIYGIAKRTKTNIDAIVAINNWESIDTKTGEISTKMGIKMPLERGNYIHLPSNFLPDKGVIFYKEEAYDKEIRYVAVQKEEGYWQSKPLQIGKKDNIKDKILDFIGEEYLGNKKVNGFSLNLELMVEGKVYALVNVAFKLGSELSIKTSDTRAVNVSLSVMPSVGFSLGQGDYKVGVGAGMKFSLDYFRVLNGSYSSYSHFIAFLQLAFFRTFTDFSTGVNMIEKWDDSTWKELAKGYTRKELKEYFGNYEGSFKLNQKNLKQNGIDVAANKGKLLGSKYKLSSAAASSFKVKGLDKNLAKRDTYEKERALKNWEPNEKKAMRDDLSYALSTEKKIGGINVTHEIRDTQFSTNRNTLGITNSFEIEYPITKSNAESLLSFQTPSVIGILKNIAEAVGSFNIIEGPESILKNIDINQFMDIETASKKWEAGSDIKLIFKAQLLSEEDVLPNLQYVRMSIKGNIGVAYNPLATIQLSGKITGEHEIAEMFGTGTISYLSSVFNAINSEKGTEFGLDQPKFSTNYNHFIQDATKKAKEEHLRHNGRLTDVNTKIPTLSDLLKSYQQDERLLEIRNTLLSQTMSEWKGFIGKDNKDYDQMIIEFSNNIREVVLKYVNDPNRRVWKWSDIAGDIHGLSEKQCEYYLGDMNVIGEYFEDKNDRKNQGEYKVKTSLFFKSIFKDHSFDIKRSFEKDILFPLFIENKVYSNISYNG